MGFLSANPVPIEAEGKQELSTEEFVDKNIHYFENSIIYFLRRLCTRYGEIDVLLSPILMYIRCFKEKKQRSIHLNKKKGVSQGNDINDIVGFHISTFVLFLS